MAEKTVIIEIDIDTNDAVKEIQQLKQRVSELKDKTDDLKKTQGDTSEEYIRAQAEYKATQDELKQTENLTKKLTSAQQTNAGTIQKLEAENAKLRKEQKALNLETKEGVKRNSEINKKINENTEVISNNSDKTKQNKMNVGNYAESLDGLSGGFMSATKSALRFIATPIGAIIAAIVIVVTAVVKAFKRSEDSMNKLKTVTGALSGAFSGLINMLKPVVNFIADTVIVVFETLAKVAEKAMALVSKGLRALGFEGAATAVDNFTSKIKEASKAGMELAKMEAELQKAQRQTEKVQLDYQKRAEKLRQLRDDETKSVAERMKINEQLGAVLKDQLKEEMKIANLALKIAEKRVALEGESTANLDALAEAQTRVSDIQERLAGQESEQLSNLNGLRREALALAEEARKADEAAFNDFAKSIETDLKESNAAMRSSIEEGEQLLNDSIAAMKEEASRITAEEAQKEIDRITLDYETKQALAQENIFTMLEFEKQALETKRQQEIYYANQIGADVEAINKKYDRAELEIERAKVNAKLAIAESFAGQVAELFGEQTRIGKIAASAQTLINTYLGAQAAFAQTPGGIVIKSAAAALATAIGLKNVQKIWAVKSGLKGDSSGGGATGSADSSVGSASRTTSAPTVGEGIVSRNISPNVDNNIIAMQPTLVTDQVTVNQRSDLAKSKTAVA